MLAADTPYISDIESAFITESAYFIPLFKNKNPKKSKIPFRAGPRIEERSHQDSIRTSDIGVRNSTTRLGQDTVIVRAFSLVNKLPKVDQSSFRSLIVPAFLLKESLLKSACCALYLPWRSRDCL